jgi:hypothetical protein
LTEAQIAVENRRTAERISRLRSRIELSMTLSLAAAVLIESVSDIITKGLFFLK